MKKLLVFLLVTVTGFAAVQIPTIDSTVSNNRGTPVTWGPTNASGQVGVTVDAMPLHLLTAEGSAISSVYVKDFGALCDGVGLTNVWLTNATTELYATNTGKAFTSADVGKTILVWGAGAGGTAECLSTTIAAFVDANHVTLTAAAGRTVQDVNAGYGTDDATAVQNAINSAVTNGIPEVHFPRGICVVKGALQSTSTKNAILVVPNLGFPYGGATVPTLAQELRITGEGGATMGGGSSRFGWPGTTILCANIGDGSTTAGGKSGASFFNACDDHTGSSGYNNLNVQWKDLNLRLPANPRLAALRMRYTSASSLDAVNIDCGYSSYGGIEPTFTEAIGVEMSTAGMNGVSLDTINRSAISQFYIGLMPNEHTHVQDLFVENCHYGIQTDGGYHAQIYDHIGFQDCPYAVRVTGGTVQMNFKSVDIEHKISTGNWYDTITDFLDGGNQGQGTFNYVCTKAGAADSIIVSGGAYMMFVLNTPGTITAIPSTNLVGTVTGSGMTMSTARLVGRTTASAGKPEEIAVGTGLTLSSGSLTGSGELPTATIGTATFTNTPIVLLTTTWTASSSGSNYVANLAIPSMLFNMTTNLNLIHTTNGTANFTANTSLAQSIKVINSSGTNFPVTWPATWHTVGTVGSGFTLTNGDYCAIALEFAGPSTDQTNNWIGVAYKQY